MTTNPQSLLAARALLHSHLGIPLVSLGISGDTGHVQGGDSYHLGANQIRPRGSRDRYSVDESPRDKAGLSNYASALDVGWFEVRVGGKAHNLRSFSVWLVAQCKAGAADTRDIREVIYSPDGKTVKRWDRLGRRTTGGRSHLSHTHVSYFRDAIKAGRDQTGVYRRYLTEIGRLAGEDDDMADSDEILRVVQAIHLLVHDGKRLPGQNQTSDGGVPIAFLPKEFYKQELTGKAILAAVQGDADTDTILAAIAQHADEIKAEVDQVAAETVEALGAVDSAEEIAERLRAVLGDKAAEVGQILAQG